MQLASRQCHLQGRRFRNDDLAAWLQDAVNFRERLFREFRRYFVKYEAQANRVKFFVCVSRACWRRILVEQPGSVCRVCAGLNEVDRAADSA
jgi:hypothetical protein